MALSTLPPQLHAPVFSVMPNVLHRPHLRLPFLRRVCVGIDNLQPEQGVSQRRKGTKVELVPFGAALAPSQLPALPWRTCSPLPISAALALASRSRSIGDVASLAAAACSSPLHGDATRAKLGVQKSSQEVRDRVIAPHVACRTSCPYDPRLMESAQNSTWCCFMVQSGTYGAARPRVLSLASSCKDCVPLQNFLRKIVIATRVRALSRTGSRFSGGESQFRKIF